MAKLKSTDIRRSRILESLSSGEWLTSKDIAHAIKDDLERVRSDLKNMLKTGSVIFKPEKHRVDFCGSFTTKIRYKYGLPA